MQSQKSCFSPTFGERLVGLANLFHQLPINLLPIHGPSQMSLESVLKTGGLCTTTHIPGFRNTFRDSIYYRWKTESRRIQSPDQKYSQSTNLTIWARPTNRSRQN